jgi:hypothetical protein
MTPQAPAQPQLAGHPTDTLVGLDIDGGRRQAIPAYHADDICGRDCRPRAMWLTRN